jgi:hypothetical protein
VCVRACYVISKGIFARQTFHKANVSGQMEGRTDMKKLLVDVHNFANAPKNKIDCHQCARNSSAPDGRIFMKFDI